MSIFGNLFDFNGDGETDIFEEMMGIDFVENEERRRKREECKHYGYDCDGDDCDDCECDDCDCYDCECDDCDCDDDCDDCDCCYEEDDEEDDYEDDEEEYDDDF